MILMGLWVGCYKRWEIIERETAQGAGGTCYARTESADEKIELRAQDVLVMYKKGYPYWISFFDIKRARDGDRTRDPLLGKEVLHR